MREEVKKAKSGDSSGFEEVGDSALPLHPARWPVSTAAGVGLRLLGENPGFFVAADLAYLPALGLFTLPDWVVPHTWALLWSPVLAVLVHLLVIERVQGAVRGDEPRGGAALLRDWGRRIPWLLALGGVLCVYFQVTLPLLGLIHTPLPSWTPLWARILPWVLTALALDLLLRPVAFAVHEVVLESTPPWEAMRRSFTLGGGTLGMLGPALLLILFGVVAGYLCAVTAITLLDAFRSQVDGPGFFLTLVMPLVMNLLVLWIQASWAVLHLERRAQR